MARRDSRVSLRAKPSAREETAQTLRFLHVRERTVYLRSGTYNEPTTTSLHTEHEPIQAFNLTIRAL